MLLDLDFLAETDPNLGCLESQTLRALGKYKRADILQHYRAILNAVIMWRVAK